MVPVIIMVISSVKPVRLNPAPAVMLQRLPVVVPEIGNWVQKHPAIVVIHSVKSAKLMIRVPELLAVLVNIAQVVHAIIVAI